MNISKALFAQGGVLERIKFDDLTNRDKVKYIYAYINFLDKKEL